jgi:hypothetical protein
MIDIPKPYKEVVDKLKPVLQNLPGKLIAIDGKNSSGKTTLGRYLSCFFNVSLIETDLFRLFSEGKLEYREDEIKRIIEYRLNQPLPVILESAVVQRLLNNLNLKADFTIYIINETRERDDWLVSILAEYEKVFEPKNKANLVIELDVI